MKAFEINEDFNRNFVVSLALHVALILFAFLGGKVVTNLFKNSDVEIIRSSVRVDVVGMPKFTIKELRELQKKISTSPQETEQGAVEKTKLKDDDAPDVIKKNDLVIQEAPFHD